MLINIPDATIKSLLTDIFENYPEYSSGNALKCTDFNYKEFIYHFADTEEDDQEHILTYDLAVKGFEQFMTEFANQPEEFGNFNPFDAGEYDCGRVDMLLQYALLGEVVYG